VKCFLTKTDWLILEKNSNRGYTFFDSHRAFRFTSLFSHKSRIDRSESLEKCEVAECKNVIHPSCCKKLMAKFGKDEWEGLLFCGKRCLKLKEEYQGIIMEQQLKSIPWKL